MTSHDDPVLTEGGGEAVVLGAAPVLQVLTIAELEEEHSLVRESLAPNRFPKQVSPWN